MSLDILGRLFILVIPFFVLRFVQRNQVCKVAIGYLMILTCLYYIFPLIILRVFNSSNISFISGYDFESFNSLFFEITDFTIFFNSGLAFSLVFKFFSFKAKYLNNFVKSDASLRTVFFLFLFFFILNYLNSSGSENYIEGYQKIQGRSYVHRVFTIFLDIFMKLSIFHLIIKILSNDLNKRKNILIFFICSLVYAFFSDSRMFSFQVYLVFLFLFYINEGKIKVSLLLFSVLFIFMFFTYKGIIRAGDTLESSNNLLGEGGALILNYIKVTENPYSANLLTYLTEIFGFLPSFILPFNKIDLSTMLVANYYPGLHEIGGGMGFGVLLHGLIGYGGVELFLRGLFLGYITSLFFYNIVKFRNNHFVLLIGLAYLSIMHFNIRISSFYFLQQLFNYYFIGLIFYAFFVKVSKKIVV